MPNVDSLNRTLFIGDYLPVLRRIDSETIDLIATDPPFNKGVKAFEGIVTAGVDKLRPMGLYAHGRTSGRRHGTYLPAARC